MKAHKSVIVFLVMMLTVAVSAIRGLADIPPPPVEQDVGMPDTVFDNLQEEDCRFCHSQNPPALPGPGSCSDDPTKACVSDQDCDPGGTTGAVCVFDPVPTDSTYLPDRHHLLMGQPIPPGSGVPNPDADGDGVPDIAYDCQNCHDIVWDPNLGSYVIVQNYRNCQNCHQQTGEATAHHETQQAQDANCVYCHGNLVDNMDDGHPIPTYQPSLVTPKPSGGDGLPLNSRGKGAGACDYCHDNDPVGTTVTNMNAHHGTGFFAQGKCMWCHGFAGGGCVECHSSPQGVLNERRQIAGIGGDFQNTSHHIIGPDVSSNDCIVCHDLTYHLDGDPGTIPDPQVYLKDPDGGPSMVYDNTPTSLETFCLNCHDSDGANGNLTPFSDGKPVPNVKGVTGSMWADSAHAQIGYAGNGGNPITCFGDGSNSGCHANAHGTGTVTVTTGKGKNKTTVTETVNGEVSSWSDTDIVARFVSCPESVDVSTVYDSTALAEVTSGGGSGGACGDYTEQDLCNADTNCTWKKKTQECVAANSGGGGDPPADLEICDDGIDNDGDGKVDCADKGDCGKDPACQ